MGEHLLSWPIHRSIGVERSAQSRTTLTGKDCHFLRTRQNNMMPLKSIMILLNIEIARPVSVLIPKMSCFNGFIYSQCPSTTRAPLNFIVMNTLQNKTPSSRYV
jgi:hypothetical protein